MTILDIINKYIALIGLFIGGIIFLVSYYKQKTSQYSGTTIKLLQDEVLALQTRLNTTSGQVATLSTQVLELNKKLDDTNRENMFFKKLITDALGDYMKNNYDSLDVIKKKLT